MAKATELARTQVVTSDGVVTATVLDRISADRLVLGLIRADAGERYVGRDGNVALVSRDLKDLVISPYTEL
jgi:hypothetical protein